MNSPNSTSSTRPARSLSLLTLPLILSTMPLIASFSPCPSKPSPTALFMNKKKKARPNISSGKGFGSPSLSTSAASSTTLLQPKVPPTFSYSGSIQAQPQTPRRFVPDTIMLPDYANDGIPKAKGALFPWIIEVKKEDEIEKMRVAGRVAREVLDEAGRALGVGVTT